MEAGSSDLAFQGGLKRDCDAEGNLLPSRRRSDGRGMRLADFVAHPTSRECDLIVPQVVGMRLYSTAAYMEINNPLRDQDRYLKKEPHKLPITVAFIREALQKLRQVDALSGESSRGMDLYRGMKDVAMPKEFFVKGGTELAPMSTTSDLKVAMEYSASAKAVLLRIRTKNFMQRAPEISYLSAFPNEKEYLFPPLTFLMPTGVTETLEVDDAVFHVVDVEPSMS
jgi:hypothetical protein